MLYQSPDLAPEGRLRLSAVLQTPLAGIAQIYFQSSPVFGAIFLLCLYLSGPALAIGCVLGVCAASATAWAVELPPGERAAGTYGYNAALAGVGVCASYQLNLALVLWIVLAGVLTSLLTHALLRFKLVALTIQFVLVMWLAAAIGPSLGLQPAAQNGASCGMAPLSYAFCSLGQVSFIGAAPLGMVLWSALARDRWRYGMWMLAGAAMAWCAASVGIDLMAQSDGAALATGMGVNSVLAMLALCVHQRAWHWRVAGAALSISLCVTFGAVGLPYYTLPFVLATWMILPLSRRTVSGSRAAVTAP